MPNQAPKRMPKPRPTPAPPPKKPNKQLLMMEFKRLHKDWEDADWKVTLIGRDLDKVQGIHVDGTMHAKSTLEQQVQQVRGELCQVRNEAMYKLIAFIERLIDG